MVVSGIVKKWVWLIVVTTDFFYLLFLLSIILNSIFQIDQALKDPSYFSSFACH